MPPCCETCVVELRKAQEEILDRKLKQAVKDLTAVLGTELQSLRDQNGILTREIRELQNRWTFGLPGPTPSLQPNAEAYFCRPPRCSGDVHESCGGGQHGSPQEPGNEPGNSAPQEGPPNGDALQNSPRNEQEAQTGAPQASPRCSDDCESKSSQDDEHLRHTFHSLCQGKQNVITALQVVQMAAKQQGYNLLHPDMVDLRPRVESAIQALNKELGIMSRQSSLDPSKDLALESYLKMMRTPQSEAADGEVADATHVMRDILVREDALRKVALATSLSFDELYEVSRPNMAPRRTERILRFLDPFIGVVIIMNAVIITISTDVEQSSPVWTIFEILFTLVFILELVIKIVVFGPYLFFFGPDRYWNQFDMIVAIIATLDIIFTLLGELVSLRNFTIVRLLRFARLTKLVRVLKIKAFKELALMVNGIMAGFRTLFWAVVFLAFLLFALGVILTQTVGHTDAPYWLEVCEAAEPGEPKSTCSDSADHIMRHRKQLFGNVFRSMFTVFRCCIDGCSSVDGTPLVPYFFNTQGYWAVVCYMIFTTFVIFGLFNLIMAIFVENTIDNAKKEESKRRDLKYGEHLRVARKLQEMIIFFCTSGPEDSREAEPASRWSWRPVVEWLWRAFSTAEAKDRDDGVSDRANGNLHVQVDRDIFNDVLHKEEVKDMLEELDISIGNSSALFDILDANCNGILEVGELVHGLVKLRGTPDKADFIAPLLSIRSIQKDLKEMEVMQIQQAQALEDISAGQMRLQAALERGRHAGMRFGLTAF